MSDLPVYILIRTSNRPAFFSRMMETIKNQSYKNIVTIVHTDDPRDKYVTGDIIIKGHAYGTNMGDGAYNLYYNRLLKAIPNKPGWIHFIDDDDEYTDEYAIEKFVASSLKDHVNVCKVIRWDNKVFPRHWRKMESFQTECFMIHTDFKNRGRWWGKKGGDHHYSRQLTKQAPINWIEDLTACKLQECKGHGKRLDKNGIIYDYKNSFEPDVPVCTVNMRTGELKWMPYNTAYTLEQKGEVKVTYPDLYEEPVRVKFKV